MTARNYTDITRVNMLYRGVKSDLQQEEENPVSPEESCFDEDGVEANITGDRHQLQADQDQEEEA